LINSNEFLDFNNTLHRAVLGQKNFPVWSSDLVASANSYYSQIDPGNRYYINKYGFRTAKDFDNFGSSDVLVSGCSYTYGVGVPYEATWGAVLGEILDSSVSIIAIPGGSIHLIIDSIFKYFDNYGHPKAVFCLFPDLGRVPIIVDGKILQDANGNGHVEFDKIAGVGLKTVYNSPSKDRPKYIKKPYEVEHISTLENSTYFSIKSIRYLEQYCNTNNIEFIWSAWDKKFNNIANQLSENPEFSFNNYFDIHKYGIIYYTKENGVDKETLFASQKESNECSNLHRNIECSCGLLCHLNLIDLYGEKNFYRGTDSIGGLFHFGTHIHAHVGEAFSARLNRKKMLG
jgi:hypothetical protein